MNIFVLRKKLRIFDNSSVVITGATVAGVEDWGSAWLTTTITESSRDHFQMHRVWDANVWFLTHKRFFACAYYDILENGRI